MPTRFPNGISFIKPGVSSDYYTFTAGDITPDVSLGTVFVTATSAVTITRFDGGETGKIIFVVSGSQGVTTIQDSAGAIQLINLAYTASSTFVKISANSGNITMGNGEVLMFVHNGTDWSQVGTRVIDGTLD